MRLGVIDVGSNTVHLLVVDAHRGARPLPASSHKIELHLVETMLADGSISRAGADTLVAFVRDCIELAQEQGAEEILAFATSAIRDAPNGPAVLDRVEDEAGLRLAVLSGVNEARLTFLAARRWLGWSAGQLTVVDIGGGSLELATGLDEEPDVAISLPLGAARVSRTMLPGDPPAASDVRRVRKLIRAEIAKELRPLARVGSVDKVVGTSKTIRSIARVGGAAPSDEGLYVDRRLTRAALGEVIELIADLPASRRASLPGVSPNRAAQLLAGALVTEAVMDLLAIEEMLLCPWAMREGVILRRLDSIPEQAAQST